MRLCGSDPLAYCVKHFMCQRSNKIHLCLKYISLMANNILAQSQDFAKLTSRYDC